MNARATDERARRRAEKPMLLTGNHAVAWAARLARPKVVPVYPITPQTPILEKLTEFQAAGEFDAEVITPESEHSVMAACIPASLAGVRVFTATASQGLLLMHELLHYASGARAPIVMANVNRTLASPWAFWPDQTDSLAQRDTGWIQFYAESAQESLDTVIQAFRVAERVLLPVLVNLDAFYVSHALEPVQVPAQELVDAFLPPYAPEHRLDTAKVESWGNVVTQEMFYRHRQALGAAMDEVPAVALEADREWSELTGRGYGLIERYRCDGAAHRHRDDGQHVRHRARRGRRDARRRPGGRPAQGAAVPAASGAGAARGAGRRARGAGARSQLFARPRRRAAPGIARRALRHARRAADSRLSRGRGRRQRLAGEDRRVRPDGERERSAAGFGLGRGERDMQKLELREDADALLGPRGVPGLRRRAVGAARARRARARRRWPSFRRPAWRSSRARSPTAR